MRRPILLFAAIAMVTANGLAEIPVTADSTYNATEQFGDVVITGTRNETNARYLPMSVTVLGREQLSQRFQTSLLPLLTEQVPGLFVSARGVMGYGISTGAAGSLRMRGIGGSPNTDMLVLIDGHPQYAALMGHTIADAYQSILAERVEVVRGPGSVLYGSNAMGGVLNIITRKQKIDGMSNQARLGYGSYNTLTADYANLLRKGRFSSVLLGSYNRTDGHRKNMDFDQYNGYAKMAYDLTSNWNLAADVNYTHFNSSNPGSVSSPLIDNDSHITRGMTSASVANRYDNTSGALTFFYNWGRHKINDGYAPGKKPLDYRFKSNDALLGVNWYQTLNPFKDNTLTVGFDYQHIYGKAWNQYATSRTELADKMADELAGYANMRQTLAKVLTLDAGIRFDHHSHTGSEWIPQAGISYILPHEALLRAMVSKGFRNPTLRELYMFRPKNPDLKPERLMNYEVSFSQHLLNGSLSYELNLFYIDGDNLIETVMSGGKPLNMNSGTVYNSGFEASVNYRMNRMWHLVGNYSFLHMAHPVVAAPHHKAYLGCNFKPSERWTVATGLQLIRGLYTSVAPKEKENFLLWNLRADYRAASWLKFYVDGENLLAQSYEINAGFPMPRATVMGGVQVDF
jgi:outer membrane cobalamin receptor